MGDGGRFPKLIAFDLDYTLWDFWIDTHIEPPLNAIPSPELSDSASEPMRVEFYKDVPEILRELKGKPDVTVAAASKTAATKLAREALRLIKIPIFPAVDRDDTNAPENNSVNGMPTAIDFFDYLEIFPGSKVAHFKHLHEVTGIPYSEMLFFDDEPRNIDVQKQLVVDGMNWNCFRGGLQQWRKKRAADDATSD